MGKLTQSPTKPVVTGGLAGAATIILVWAAGAWGVEIPPEVASAITVFISGLTSHFTEA